MISIVIPVYNQADKISKCLDSILAQNILTSPQPSPSQGEGVLEVIVVNDGSKDDIAGVLENYKNKFQSFKTINQENQGANPARNRGAEETRGEYIIFCDADVKMRPEMLQTMLEALDKNPEASYAYSSFMWGRKLFPLFAYDENKLRQMPYIHTMSLVRREHFPGFDNKIRRFQDWDLWLTMLENGHKGVWINKVLFRVETGGTISNWLPKMAYRFLPFLPQVKKYNNAMRVIKEKHKLSPLSKRGLGD